MTRKSWATNPGGLAETLVSAIRERGPELDEMGLAVGDHPMEVLLTMHYHPGMAKLDLDIRVARRLPPVRAPRRNNNSRRDVAPGGPPAGGPY